MSADVATTAPSDPKLYKRDRRSGIGNDNGITAT